MTPDKAALVALGEKLKALAQECLDEAVKLSEPDPWTLRESENRGGPPAVELIARAERQADSERLVGRIYHGLARAIDEVCKEAP